MGFLEWILGRKSEPVRTWVCYHDGGSKTKVRVYRKANGYRVSQERSDGKEIWFGQYPTIKLCYFCQIVLFFKVLAQSSFEDGGYVRSSRILVHEIFEDSRSQLVGEIHTDEDRAVHIIHRDPETRQPLETPLIEVLAARGSPLNPKAELGAGELQASEGKMTRPDTVHIRDKDGVIKGSVTRLPDGGNVISAEPSADIVTGFISLSMVHSDAISKAEKLTIARWAGLTEVEWEAPHRQAYAAADLNYLLELKRTGKSIPLVAKGMVAYINKDNVPRLPAPLKDEVRRMFANSYAILNANFRDEDCGCSRPRSVPDVRKQCRVSDEAVITKSEANEFTPLHAAAYAGNMKEAKYWIGRNIDVDSADKDGQTPLHLAAYQGHREIVELLIASGADVDVLTDRLATPLTWAAFYGHREVAEILIREGADIDARTEDEQTPLYGAAQMGHCDAAKLLIASGADPNAEDSKRRTPLHVATIGGHNDIVDLLMMNGADANAPDYGGQRPLHLAAFRGDIKLVEKLIASGAEVDVEEEGGLTPLQVAAFAGHQDVVNLLRKHGARE